MECQERTNPTAVTHLTPLLTLDLKTRWYWMKGMKKLLAAMFVALLMVDRNEPD